MMSGTLPDFVLLEDANDLADFYEATRRTIARGKWAEESIAAGRRKQMESLF
jgi:hypothetical protein